jgi:site-specific recombinase XerD
MVNFSTGIVLEKRTPRKDKSCPVKLRVIIDRKTRYFGTGHYLSEEDFKRAFSSKPPRRFKDLRSEVNQYEEKAAKILKALDRPNFDQFRRLFTQRGNGGNIEKYYQAYIADCKKYNRFGTASNYECSLKSLQEVKGLSGANFRDITPAWLEDYYHKMESRGKSVSTIGIYLRPLRMLYNRAIRDGVVDAAYYPFGSEKAGLFEIPSSENTKRPLSMDELELLAGYSGNPAREKYRDFFILSFYLMGLNYFDLLTLKWNQYHGDNISLIRTKTKRTTRKKQKPIELPVNEGARELIEKHGNPQGVYIFDVISTYDHPQEVRLKVQNFTRNSNQALKAIAKEINTKAQQTLINPAISNVFARHSAASHAIQSGASLPLVSQTLGHTNPKTTINYFSSFEKESKQMAQSLLIGKNTVPKMERGTNDPEAPDHEGKATVPPPVPCGTTKKLVDNQ